MGVATGALTVVLSSSVGSDFIDAHPPCWAIVLYQGCTIHTCIAVAMDDLCWTPIVMATARRARKAVQEGGVKAGGGGGGADLGAGRVCAVS